METDRRRTLSKALIDDGYIIAHRRTDSADPHSWGLTARKGEYELVIEEYPLHVPLFDRHRTG